MKTASKKPSLALIISSIGKDHDDDEDEHSKDSDDESYEAARDELAELVGVKDDDREAFGDALRAFIMTCK